MSKASAFSTDIPSDVWNDLGAEAPSATVATAGSAPPLVDTSDVRHELGVAVLSVIVTSAALSFPPTCPSDVWNDAGRAMAADFSISVVANDQLLKSQLLLQEICGLVTDNGDYKSP